jgi:hypothetical protein
MAQAQAQAQAVDKAKGLEKVGARACALLPPSGACACD